jgi:phosphate transport system permease protein
MPDAPHSVSQPPTPAEKLINKGFRGLTFGLGWGTILVLGGVLVVILLAAVPSMGEHGLGFLGGQRWSASDAVFGILPEIAGTLYTSFIALILGGVLGIAMAIFLSQSFLPPKLELVMKNIIELLAAIPSVVYGLWGIFVVIPAIRPLCDWLHENLSWIPFFSTPLAGPGILPASLVLAIMILPTVTAISREAMAAVPKRLHEASYGLGATKWETIFRVVLPTSSTGVFGAVVIAFGRALGETMALAMLVGNANVLGWSLFSPGRTLASLLALQFPEAGKVEVGALMYAALVLLVITLLVNIVGSLVMARASRGLKGLN